MIEFNDNNKNEIVCLLLIIDVNLNNLFNFSARNAAFIDFYSTEWYFMTFCPFLHSPRSMASHALSWLCETGLFVSFSLRFFAELTAENSESDTRRCIARHTRVRNFLYGRVHCGTSASCCHNFIHFDLDLAAAGQYKTLIILLSRMLDRSRVNLIILLLLESRHKRYPKFRMKCSFFFWSGNFKHFPVMSGNKSFFVSFSNSFVLHHFVCLTTISRYWSIGIEGIFGQL